MTIKITTPNGGADSLDFGCAQTAIVATVTGTEVSSGEGKLEFKTTTGGTSATKATVLANGNVGINKTAPVTKLHIEGGGTSLPATTGTTPSAGTTLRIRPGNNAILDIGGHSTSGAWLQSYDQTGMQTEYPLLLNPNGGDVSIGGTTRTAKLNVIGTGGSNVQIQNNIASGTGTIVSIGFINDNGLIGSIQSGGSATSYVTSSDYRLKENVEYEWSATERLKKLKPARFNFIADAEKTFDGFLAHEAQEVVPEAVTGVKDEVDADDKPVMQGIDQAKLVPLLVKTILELEARITALEG